MENRSAGELKNLKISLHKYFISHAICQEKKTFEVCVRVKLCLQMVRFYFIHYKTIRLCKNKINKIIMSEVQ